jgi:hypothetical protein
MQRLEVSGAVRPIYESLGVKRLRARRFNPVTYRKFQSAIMFYVLSEIMNFFWGGGDAQNIET